MEDQNKMDDLDFPLEDQKKRKRCQAKSIGMDLSKKLQVSEKEI